MDKIAIVVQRYGTEINGGAELHARQLAEQLAEKYDITVLTTCALDYAVWANHYPKGETTVNDIKTIRFETEPRDRRKLRKLYRYLRENLKYQDIKYSASNFLWLPFKKFRYRRRKNHDGIFHEWLRRQGPYCVDMIKYIDANKDNYAAFIFFTYLYHPTNVGIVNVAHKSILIPTAHDEIQFYFEGIGKLFSRPKFIMYNTLSEKRLVENTYPNSKLIKSDTAGIGFDKPNVIEIEDRKRPSFKYILYIGRIDEYKGCKVLVDYFNEFKEKSNADLRLIMVGKNYLSEEITSKDVILTGFIDDDEKMIYLKNCEALVIPSPFESLSMVTLEAFIAGKPVLANRDCEVLKDHVETSNAGFLYNNKVEFAEVLNKTLSLTDTEKELMAANGVRYVEENYNWKSIVDKFESAIDYIKLN